jgi:hypothetical protein
MFAMLCSRVSSRVLVTCPPQLANRMKKVRKDDTRQVLVKITQEPSDIMRIISSKILRIT